jgi:serine/threonine protein kinase
VTRCIPHVYYKRAWPRRKWDGEQPDDDMEQDPDEILYGLVMEYFDDFQEIDMKKADIHLAEVLGKTLERIHEGGVIHNDIEERNILLVREAGSIRIVWIDFSCAWTGIRYRRTRSVEWDMFRGFLLQEMVIPRPESRVNTDD